MSTLIFFAEATPLNWHQVLLPLLLAVFLGGLLGLEREIHGNLAGLRTHMLVALGAAVFALAAREIVGGDMNALSRVLQGVATGVGFIGAGTILKLSNEKEVRGLTTAASIWLAAALGVAVAVEEYRLALWATLVSMVVLALLRPLEKRWEKRKE